MNYYQLERQLQREEEILEEQYESGEITFEEFNHLRRDLENEFDESTQ